MEHLIHIGYGKAGSKYLQQWFAAHPQLRFKPGSLASYHSPPDLCRDVVYRGEDGARYLVTSAEGFAIAWVRPDDQSQRESHAALLANQLKHNQRGICIRLRDLFPTARILIVTRGFVSAARSRYSEYIKGGGTLSYPAHLETYLNYLTGWLDFDYVMGLYWEMFGRDRVVVLPYELLRDDTAQFLSQIETWLALDSIPFPTTRVNPGLSEPELYWYPRLSARVAALTHLLRGRGVTLYNAYVTHILRQRRLLPLLERLRARHEPAEQVAALEQDLARRCAGKASRLRDNPLYARYAKEYLWAS